MTDCELVQEESAVITNIQRKLFAVVIDYNMHRLKNHFVILNLFN